MKCDSLSKDELTFPKMDKKIDQLTSCAVGASSLSIKLHNSLVVLKYNSKKICKKKMKKINVENQSIRISVIDLEDFICLSDMIQSKEGDFFVSDWLRNRNTLEFLGLWESIHNPHFNYGEFAIIKNHAGLNNFKLSVKQYNSLLNGKEIIAKTGRYAGTFAHQDIAFEFATWVSPSFKLYLIKAFQKLKSEEQKSFAWTAKRELAKVNYHIHTHAIQKHIIPALLNKKTDSKYLCQ